MADEEESVFDGLMAGSGANVTSEHPTDNARERRLVAALRQRHRKFACRKPAIEQGRTRPRLFKLEGDLDRRLLAGHGPMLNG